MPGKYKIRKPLLWVIAALFLFRLSPVNAAGLSGTYDVCSSCTYSSISSAANDLNAKGVSGPVVFNIHAGTYTDFASLKNISGSSTANTIIFSGAGMDNTIIKANYTFLLSLNNVQYISFKNLTLRTDTSGQAVVMSSVSFISFDHCRIKATSYFSKASLKAYGISMQDADHCSFSNNRFEGGYNSIVNFGSAVGGNNAFTNNKFTGFYTNAISASPSKQSGNIYSNNIFDSSLYSARAAYGLSIYYENGVSISNNRCMNCGIMLFNLNNNSESATCTIANNYIYTNVKLGVLMDMSFSKGNILVAHNTLYASPSSAPDHGFYARTTGTGRNIRIMNNLFDIEKQSAHYNVYIDGPPADFSAIDGNDYYSGSGNVLDSVYFFGKKYLLYDRLYKDAKNLGFEVYSTNMKPAYKTAGDVHLDTTVANPTGTYAGIDTDIDGDLRCSIAPTAGADESRFGKYNTPTASISGPDSVYDRTPITFVDTVRNSRLYAHHWYVNGKLVSDSLGLLTALARYPSVTIALVTNSCNGKDSIAKTFSVIYPSKAPVTDFTADNDTVKENGIVHFTDLSSNAPTHWQWHISQDMNAFHGVNKTAFKYLKSSDTSQNPVVQFLSPGRYYVCLSTSNVLKNGKTGQGDTLCKEDYIYVEQFSPILTIAGPDTLFGGVNKASKQSLNAPKILSALDSAGYAVTDTFFPASVPLNKVDTVMVTYIATDDAGDSVIDYRWLIVYDTTAPVLYLVGSDTEIIEFNSLFTDSGVAVSDNYYTASVLDPLVVVDNNLYTRKCGIYRIIYSLTDPSGNKAKPVTRVLIVQDTIAPKISIHGNMYDTVLVNTTYNDSASAPDNDDKNVKISRSGTFYTAFPSGKPDKLGTYTIIYNATDQCGNAAGSVVKTVTVVDTLAPKVTLLGDPTGAICKCTEYIDSGFAVKDNYWKSGFKIDTGGTFYVNHQFKTNVSGLYFLQYTATDSSGNIGYSAKRYVRVRPLTDGVCGGQSTDGSCNVGIVNAANISSHISLYPNPTTGSINISSDLFENERIKVNVLNALGQTMATVNESSLGNTISFNIGSQPAGMYLIYIYVGQQLVVKRVMLSK
jgi:PKD repeat protein